MSIMGVELKQLRYFVAVAGELNFSAAARRLYVSQQALSRIIQQLEHELGVRLFHRTTRSVTLTEAGRALLVSAQSALAAVDDAVQSAQRVGSSPRPLRVDLSSGSLRTPALILRKLRRTYPDLPLQLVEDGVPRGLTALADGRLDALIGLATHCPPDIPAESVRREPVLLGMVAEHPLAQMTTVPVSALADTELLLPSDFAAIEWVEFVRTFCAEAGVEVRRWPGATHGGVAAADVLRDVGCVTPTVAWAEPPADLVFRPLVEPTPVLTWSVMTAPAAHGSDELGAFLATVRSLAGAQHNHSPMRSGAVRPTIHNGAL
ncbi:LysR family transcriptional regulator [Nocardia blacklockiae]|uniref:LysR family transcriptional regulator n=1 Tax=Nocardia blacklockiae TaxID=480036 RepID=UPI0018950640|nr:LysR family transcriptional regulator [Nocardia blacklockiae]MBF6175809.1 LysR family transcriptional regulator [Nocardia blacklockiae]